MLLMPALELTCSKFWDSQGHIEKPISKTKKALATNHTNCHRKHRLTNVPIIRQRSSHLIKSKVHVCRLLS